MISPVIVVIGYNRPNSIRRLLQSIEDAYYPAEGVTLIVSIDHSDNQSQVLAAAQSVKWSHGEVKYVCREDRMGLKKHVISCGDYSLEYGAAIILEDDLVVSRNFYDYAYQALNHYDEFDEIAGISLYSFLWNGYANYQFIPLYNGYDVYFGQFSISWGQCWTRKQWSSFKQWYADEASSPVVDMRLPELIELYGEKSWGKYFAKYIVNANKFYVVPYNPLSTNCSEVGEHSSIGNNTFQVPLAYGEHKRYSFPNMKSAVKYDMFAERIFDDDMVIHGIPASKVCFDINGLHRDAVGKQFILTCKKISNVECLASYGMVLKPIECNVEYAVDGDGIYLYQFEDVKDKLYSINNYSFYRMNYELSGYNNRKLLKYVIDRLICKRGKK